MYDTTDTMQRDTDQGALAAIAANPENFPEWMVALALM